MSFTAESSQHLTRLLHNSQLGFLWLLGQINPTASFPSFCPCLKTQCCLQEQNVPFTQGVKASFKQPAFAFSIFPFKAVSEAAGVGGQPWRWAAQPLNAEHLRAARCTICAHNSGSALPSGHYTDRATRCETVLACSPPVGLWSQCFPCIIFFFCILALPALY